MDNTKEILNLSTLLANEVSGIVEGDPHTKDADCAPFMIRGDDTCPECGTWHGAPCSFCGGRGFHDFEADEESGEPVKEQTCSMLYAELMREFEDER